MRRLALILLLSSSPAYSQQLAACFDKTIALKVMAETLHQPLIMGGKIETGEDMLLFADVVSGKWTLAFIQANKLCFIADGDGLAPVTKGKNL